MAQPVANRWRDTLILGSVRTFLAVGFASLSINLAKLRWAVVSTGIVAIMAATLMQRQKWT
jgi:hypothetical protein